MPVNVILGLQRGDEGKGKFVDMLTPEHDIGARFGGGNNAGHTVVDNEGEIYKLHGLPSSVVYEHAVSVIGNGAVINAVSLCQEIDTLKDKGIEINDKNLLISGGSHLTLPHHIVEDKLREAGQNGQGSTKSGIAQVYGAKSMRLGIRAEIINNNIDLLEEVVLTGLINQRQDIAKLDKTTREDLELDNIDEQSEAKKYADKAKLLGAYVTDTVRYLNMELIKGSKILAEGAQAFLLDLDHGMYPYVTSSSTTIGGVSTGLGVPPKHFDRIIGVIKATQSHVGGGPFVTEIHDQQLLERLHGDQSAVDAEYGTTTGRSRRLGILDLAQIRRANMINGTTEIAITKLDWLPRYGDTIPICLAYERKNKILDDSVDAAYKLDQSTPTYASLPSWQEDVQDVRRFEDLPDNAQKYIEFIEAELKLPATMIGVGPGRDQTILR